MKIEENKQPEWYCESSALSLSDQEWIWKNIPNSDKDNSSECVSINGSVNGTCKRIDNFSQTLDKPQAIAKLSACNYLTPPKEIAFYLESIFGLWEEKPSHWLFIAQRYTPKTINSILHIMTIENQRGDKTIYSPGAYFTSLIRYRSKRKTFRSTNGTSKNN